VGLVVYTGMQTKLKMNDEEVQPKRTQVETLMNTMIGYLLKVQVAMVCLFGAFSRG
jgi:magnesium-transporting ATPase (P-type)